MRKFLTILFMTLLAYAVGYDVGWAAEVTFTHGIDNTSTKTMTKDGVTLTISAGTFDSSTNYYRVDKSNTLKIECDDNITSLQFTCTSNSYAALASASVGTYTQSTQSWSGTAKSITLSTKSGKNDNNFRFTKLIVTTASSSSSHTLTDGSSNGSVTFTVGGNSVESPATAAKDAVVSLSATPNRGYTFDSWTAYKTGDTSIPVTVSNNQFTMPDYDVTVVANFTALTAYSLSGNGTNGSVAFSVPGVTGNVTTAYHGETVTATATAATGYELGTLTVDGNDVTSSVSNDEYTFNMPAHDVTVSATFNKVDYTLTRNSNSLSMGDVKITDEQGNILQTQPTTAQKDDVVYFKLTTEYGYIADTNNPVTVTNTTASETITPTLSNGVYSFAMPAGNVTIAATFIAYVPTVKIAGSANGRSTFATTDPLPVMTHSSNRTYSANVYFTGEESSDKVDYFHFLVDGVAVKAKANGNYWVTNFTSSFNPFYSSNSGDTDANLRIEPGVYTITISIPGTDRSQWSMSVTKNTYALAFNPAAGEVQTGTSVSASCAQLAADIEAIQTADSGAAGDVSVGVNTDYGNTWNASETLNTKGSATVYGRAAIGNFAVTGTASYTVSNVTTATATLSNADIVASGEADTGYKNWELTSSDGKTWNAYCIKNKHSNATSAYHAVQIKKYASNTAYYLQVPEYGSKITKLVMTVSNTSQPMNGGGNTATLYFSNSAQTSAAGTGVASGTGSSSIEIECADLNLNTGYITASAGIRIWDVKVYYLTAEEEKDYTIDYAEVTGGSASGPEGADANKTVTVTVTPDTGFACTGISVTTDDENYPTLTATGSGNSYSFDVPVLAAGSTITVTPSFATAYQITYEYGDSYGTVNGPANAIAGATVSFTVSLTSQAASNGYIVSGITVTGVDAADITDNGNGTYSFTMPAAATTVTVTFAKKPYNITVVSVGGTGTVTGLPENAKAVSATPISFTITPDHGYEVSNVVLRYASTSTTLTADNGTYSFTMPGQDVTITVTYYVSNDYKLLTDVRDINEESTYLLVGGPAGSLGTYDNVMGPKSSGNNYTDAVDITGHYNSNTGILSSTPNMALIQFEAGSGDNEGKYAIKTHEGYFNESELFSTTPSYFSISLGGSSRATIAGTSKYLGYNTQYPRWTFYNGDNNGATYIFKLPSTLAEIISIGIQGKTYTVTDALVGVHAVGNILYAKDEAASIDVKEKPEGYSDFLLEEAFTGKAKTELNSKGITVPDSYSQNNWIALVMPEGTSADSYKGKYLPASTVTGVLTDDVNYKLTLTKAPGEPVNTEAYTKNVYTPANFVSTFWDENTDQIYFVKPKVQEVANIAWAVWNGTSFVMPENCPAGSFTPDFTLNEDPAPTLETGKAYAFMAVMENGGSSLSGIRRLKSGDSPATFNIKPLNLTSSSPVTGISNVGGSVKEVQSVRVYNVAGVEQRELQPGVNIVVTTYTDGTRSTAKVLR